MNLVVLGSCGRIFLSILLMISVGVKINSYVTKARVITKIMINIFFHKSILTTIDK